jgi:hypothetical protein
MFCLAHPGHIVRKPFLSYFKGKKILAARRKRCFVVRVFHPRGHYPRGIVAQAEGLYCADDELVFCVTSTQSMSPAESNAPYTEMDWMTPDELRFIGSIYLCELWGGTKLMFYPIHYYSPVINRAHLDLRKNSIQEEIRNLVVRGIYYPQDAWQQAAILQECISLRYSLISPEQVDLSRQSLLWKRAKTTDHLLLRGLSALMKSDMLSCYPEFMEEAAISCFIALDASFHMVLRRLTAGGKRNPSAKNAAKWLYEHFDMHLGFPEPLERYFAEFYDQRVMTLHPASRFGEFIYPPLSNCDYFHLRASLRSIFAYLLTDAHDRGFTDDIERHRRRRE